MPQILLKWKQIAGLPTHFAVISPVWGADVDVVGIVRLQPVSGRQTQKAESRRATKDSQGFF